MATTQLAWHSTCRLSSLSFPLSSGSGSGRVCRSASAGCLPTTWRAIPDACTSLSAAAAAAFLASLRVFGWTESNEIGNGRWVMFGVFVGLLTEYATGVDFPNQIRLMLSYLGIVDMD